MRQSPGGKKKKFQPIRESLVNSRLCGLAEEKRVSFNQKLCIVYFQRRELVVNAARKRKVMGGASRAMANWMP